MSQSSHRQRQQKPSPKVKFEEDHQFSSLFDSLAHLEIDPDGLESRQQNPLSRSPEVVRPQQSHSLDKELELVKSQKEKLTLELEVLHLRQRTTLTSDYPANASGQMSAKDSPKIRTIDWPQDFVPVMHPRKRQRTRTSDAVEVDPSQAQVPPAVNGGSATGPSIDASALADTICSAVRSALANHQQRETPVNVPCFGVTKFTTMSPSVIFF
ncbi:hypothetical protein QZH41_007920 [Actinostola sp. cb2023]|nr:hypothetical protein QZH41_007920 [Actinostola sp. cb2023]